MKIDSVERAAKIADRASRSLEKAHAVAQYAGELAEAEKLRKMAYARWNEVFEMALAKYRGR